MNIESIGLGLAFLAGLASFFSPCVFALVPAYIGYLGGRTAAASENDQNSRWIALSHGFAFVLGFSTVFILLGVATSALGSLLYDMRDWITKIGGILVIILGIHMTGIYRIKWLEYDLRPQSIQQRNRGYLASAMMGVFFSAGWSPCVGPILGAILTLSLAGGSILQGASLLTAYSAGLAIPFLFASVEIDLISSVIRKHGRVMHYVEIVTGVMLIVIGILLFSGRFERLASLGTFIGAFDEVRLGLFLLGVAIGLILLGTIPAYIASKKGRKFFDWWLFGAGLFPIALPAAIMLKPQNVEQEVVPQAQ